MARSGFTLMELVVVMAIMGIALAAAVPLLRDQHQAYRLEQETARMLAALHMAQQDALIHGREWGMAVRADGYSFLHFDADTKQWTAPSEAVLANYTLPDSLRLNADVSNQLILADDAASQQRPEILLLSNGQTSAFTLRLQIEGNGEVSAVLTADGHSEIRPIGDTHGP